tara:strand:- start:291 stop:743 length:453 start_codon:yes stop_codon:yes gene_type:complete
MNAIVSSLKTFIIILFFLVNPVMASDFNYVKKDGEPIYLEYPKDCKENYKRRFNIYENIESDIFLNKAIKFMKKCETYLSGNSLNESVLNVAKEASKIVTGPIDDVLDAVGIGDNIAEKTLEGTVNIIKKPLQEIKNQTGAFFSGLFALD